MIDPTTRALIERMADELDRMQPLPAFPPDTPHPLADEARALLAAEPQGEGKGPALQWSENRPPCPDCRYNHCIAETPFGRFLITWKGWKEYPVPTVDETPWGGFYEEFDSVDQAKVACQHEMDERLARWGRPAKPPAEGEVGEKDGDIIRVYEMTSILASIGEIESLEALAYLLLHHPRFTIQPRQQ